jgi:hypothetical protein
MGNPANAGGTNAGGTNAGGTSSLPTRNIGYVLVRGYPMSNPGRPERRSPPKQPDRSEVNQGGAYLDPVATHFIVICTRRRSGRTKFMLYELSEGDSGLEVVRL